MLEKNLQHKIGLGGGCHWCTEGVFQSLKGIHNVDQGWIASEGENATFSEAIVVEFDPEIIDLHSLIEIHLHTHASTSDHSMRDKYRSAIYVFSNDQKERVKKSIDRLQADFEKTIITRTLPFVSFKENEEGFLDYFYNRPDAPFCQTYIHPKLSLLMERFSDKVDNEKVNSLIKT